MKVVVFILFLFAVPLWSEEKKSLDYIYVNANTGQSSGGHSAIRLDDLVYHFQYFPDKIFHIVREPWENFHYVYGIQENRTIFIRKIILSKENFDFFLSRMNEIYLLQKKELDNLVKLDNDAKILESVLNGNKTFHLKASGYFANKNTKEKDYASLQERIINEFGKNYIIKNLHQNRTKIYNFNFTKHELPNSIFYSKRFPKSIDNFSSEYIELVSLFKVFTILYEESELNSESILEASSDDLLLEENHLVKLSFFLKGIENEIINLFKSN